MRLHTALLLAMSVGLAMPLATATKSVGQPQGASPPDLLATEWLLEDLGGAGVIDNARATLGFPEPGKAAGLGSCNQFTAAIEFNGDAIAFSPLAATHKQCADAVSDQEGRYFEALHSAYRLTVEGPYLLVHTKALPKPLRYTLLTRSKP